MASMKRYFMGITFFLANVFAQAVTIQDEEGDFTIDEPPSRIVALEYSYVDALAQVGISPVGVADDNDKNRIPKNVRDKIIPWTSVGTRSQPSLEAISTLKPDLIIADVNRHIAVYDALKKIAPTLMLRSSRESYQENLESAQKIATVVGKEAAMKTRIADYQKYLSEIAKKVPKGQKVVFGTSRENQFNLYTDKSYAGGLLKALGFVVPSSQDGSERNDVIKVGLEQLAIEQPDWLIVAHYRNESIIKKWENEPLWQTIPAVKNNHVFSVDSNIWARTRGIGAAEIMIGDIQKNMGL